MTANFLSLRVNAQGRTFTADDGQAGAPLSVVLIYGCRGAASAPAHMSSGRTCSSAGRQIQGDRSYARGFRFLEGRWLEQTDGTEAPRAVVVNEIMARNYWPGKDPIGSRSDTADIFGAVVPLHACFQNRPHAALERRAVNFRYRRPVLR